MNLWQGMSHSLRSLRRAPLFSAAVVLTLTIGIGSAAAIFAVVNAVLLRPLPYGHPDRLVGVWDDLPPLSLNHTDLTSGIYFTYKRFAHTIEGRSPCTTRDLPTSPTPTVVPIPSECRLRG